jgi:hypothetical protein
MKFKIAILLYLAFSAGMTLERYLSQMKASANETDLEKNLELNELSRDAELWLATHQHLPYEEIKAEMDARSKFFNQVALS